MSSEYFAFSKDTEKRLGWITFTRPEKHNMLTSDEYTSDELPNLLREIEKDEDVKVLILKGAGENFGVGADIMILGPDTIGFSRDATKPKPRLGTRIWHERHMFLKPFREGTFFSDFCKPVIAQVQGYAYGWHFQVCTSADIIVASEEALFTHPAFRYITESWPSWAFMSAMGYKRFAEMMLTGRAFTAREMEQCGFVNRVVPKEQLESTALEIASVMAVQPYDLLMAGKQFLETLREMSYPAGANRVSCYGHLLSTYYKTDPGDFSIMRETTKSGASGAIKSREERYPPKYRLSYRGRKADK